MEQKWKALLTNLAPIIARKELFLGTFRRVGLNILIFLYYFPNEDTVSTIDIILFDTAEETLESIEVTAPEHLHYVTSLELMDHGIHGRKTALLEVIERTNESRRKVYFSDAAFYQKSMPVHRER